MTQSNAAQVKASGLRELPRNIEAEQIVLGSALLEAETVVPILIEALKPEHFYHRAHRVLFRAIREMFDRGDPIDVVTMANHLEEQDQIDAAGGRMYLNELLDRVTTTASLEYYSGIVRKKAVFRSLIEAGGVITELGYNEALETDEVLDKAESIVFGVSAAKGEGASYHHVRDFLYDHIAALEELHRDPNRHTVTGFSTGFPKLDEMTSGLQRSDLLVLAGRPGTGKTSFALALARHVAIRESATVAVFSLEMSKEQLLERLLCGEGKVSLHRLRGGYVPSAKWRDLAMAASKLQQANVLIDETPGISIFEIRAKARRMHAAHGLDMVIVDYLQLVEGSIRTDVREQEIAHISRSLKKLARELNIPVIAVSQLNRAVERRESKRPQLADLRESGAIEQDADIVAFIYRKDYYDQPGDENTVAAQGASADSELIIAKQRNGPLGTVPMTFHRAYASFYPQAWDPSKKGDPEAE